MNNKKIKFIILSASLTFFLFGFWFLLKNKEILAVDVGVSPFYWQAPTPRKYRWDFVKNNGDPNCVFDSEKTVLECRYPVGIVGNGDADAVKIMKRICDGEDAEIIGCPLGAAACVGLDIASSDTKRIKLQGLVRKNSAGYYRFSAGYITTIEDTLNPRYMQSVYPAAKKGQELIKVQLDMRLWKLSEKDKKTLAKVNKYLPEIAEKNLEEIEKHEETHVAIFRKGLNNGLDIINDLSSIVQFTGFFKNLSDVSQKIEQSFSQAFKENEDLIDKLQSAFEIEETERHSRTIESLPIPNTTISCTFAIDYVRTVFFGPISSSSRPREGIVDFSADSYMKCYLGGGDYCNALVWKDTKLTLTAKPAKDEKFVKWRSRDKGNSCLCEGMTNPVCKFIVKTNTACFPEFKKNL